MRSTSVKNLAVAVSIALTIAAAAPTATAAPNKPTHATVTRADRERDFDRIVRSISRAMKRFFNVSAQNQISPPIPAPSNNQ